MAALGRVAKRVSAYRGRARQRAKADTRMTSETTDSVVEGLERIGAVKFGKFTLKSGAESPVYVDLRLLTSHPELLSQVAEQLVQVAKSELGEYDLVCGVPYTGLPIATAVSLTNKRPMVMKRKEKKSYGMGKQLEGEYKEGQRVLIVEDIVTSGGSVVETARALREAGLEVAGSVVVMDREQGAKEALAQEGIRLASAHTLSDALNRLEGVGSLPTVKAEEVRNWLSSASVASRSSGEAMGERKAFTERAEMATNTVASRIFSLIARKGSNLCVAADSERADALLALAEQVGPYIFCLKTHADAMPDMTPKKGEQLAEIARRQDFMVFEDRKFADIGSVSRRQLEEGPSSIPSWASLVDCHALPGPAQMDALSESGLGVLVVVEMSSDGSLANIDYTTSALSMAFSADGVVGVICQKPNSWPLHLRRQGVLHLTPGVKLGHGEGDGMGQSYTTPRNAILDGGSDAVVVGRGVIAADDPAAAAAHHRDAAWAAYCDALGVAND